MAINTTTIIGVLPVFSGIRDWLSLARVLEVHLPDLLDLDAVRWERPPDPAILATTDEVVRVSSRVDVAPAGHTFGTEREWGGEILVIDVRRFDKVVLVGRLLLGRGQYADDAETALRILAIVLEMVAYTVVSASGAEELMRRRVAAWRRAADADQSRKKGLIAAIHDNTLNQLARLRMACDMQASYSELYERLVRVQQDFNEVLKLAGVEGRQLEAKLRTFIDDINQSGQGEVTLDYHDPECRVLTFSDELAEDCYQIIQEGVNNALKHSGSSRVHISFIVTGYLVIEVTDFGRGNLRWAEYFTSGPRMGLRNIRDRIRRQRGHIRVETAPKRGTCLRAEIIMSDDQWITAEANQEI